MLFPTFEQTVNTERLIYSFDRLKFRVEDLCLALLICAELLRRNDIPIPAEIEEMLE